ncbi:hypothetical protein, partial [Neisseria sicca]|uniref:hypothetical protein n=1 Tax=Neisseria sicca TaxID=490 RepID=UPI001C993E98
PLKPLLPSTPPFIINTKHPFIPPQHQFSIKPNTHKKPPFLNSPFQIPHYFHTFSTIPNNL